MIFVSFCLLQPAILFTVLNTQTPDGDVLLSIWSSLIVIADEGRNPETDGSGLILYVSPCIHNSRRKSRAVYNLQTFGAKQISYE